MNIVRHFLFSLLLSLSGICLASLASAENPWLGPVPPGGSYPAGEEDRQFAVLEYDLAGRARVNSHPTETFRKEALIDAADRDPWDVVIRRTGALLAHITTLPGAPALQAEKSELEVLRKQAAEVNVADKSARRDGFNRAIRLRRRIAFANPLLNFHEIAILKRQVASMYGHMCDQFYGIAQEPGGGLFVLSDPFANHLGDVGKVTVGVAV